MAVGNLASFSVRTTFCGTGMGRLIYGMVSLCMFHPDILEGTLLVSFLLSLLTKICFNYTVVPLFIILFVRGWRKTCACDLSTYTWSPQQGILTQQHC